MLKQERVRIARFLDTEIETLTRRVLAERGDSSRAVKEQTLIETIAARRAGGDSDAEIEASGSIKKLRADIAALPDQNALEIEVYNGLTDFFGRYYDAGDFLAKPRYRKDVYALPYNGEEVKLHWANRDQFYIKSAQVLDAFAFETENQKVRFAIREAAHEGDNNKEERKFVLALDDNQKPWVESQNGVWIVAFDFKKDARKQRQLNEEAAALLASCAAPKLDAEVWRQKLNNWTARASFDFFVHKNLGVFLRRELDFYLKNEIVALDSLFGGQLESWNQTTLAKATAMHQLGTQIIDFLARLEELQKRLWLKQKWVTQARAIVPFGLVPPAMQAEVLQNEAQIQEWQTLYGVETAAISLVCPVAWTKPPGMEWADHHMEILVDGAHFEPDWTRRLWSELSRGAAPLDELWNGILFHADNFAALNLMGERFAEQVKCIYIDPPYNTSISELLYKNGYKQSTWISMMENRLQLSISLMKDDGMICVTIDDYEHDSLAMLMDDVFGTDNRIATAIIRNNPQGRSTVKGFSVNHEFGLFYSRNISAVSIGRLARNEKQNSRYDEMNEEGEYFSWVNFRKTGTDSKRQDRWKQFFPIYIEEEKARIPEMQWEESTKSWEILEKVGTDTIVVWPIDEAGEDRVWSFGVIRAKDEIETMKVEKVGDNYQVYRPLYVNSKGALPRTWWDDPRYAAGSHGTNLLTNMFGSGHSFLFPKSVNAVEDSIIVSATQTDSLILDYFAGSGTTGHAVMNLNRADGAQGHRKFVLVEMGRYFESVLVPRLKKAAYADAWKDGRPANSARRGALSPVLLSYRLESYEDALEHLAAERLDESGQARLEVPDDAALISYAPAIETQNGAITLRDDLFEAPFAMQMRVGGESAGQAKQVTLDAVATFNWLLGLRIHKMWWPNDKLGAVCGLMPDERPVVIVWRHLRGENADDSDAALLDFWRGDEILAKWRASYAVGAVYLNGDSSLAALLESAELLPLESEFRRLMFAVAARGEAAQ